MRYSRMRWRGNNELFAFANDSPCSALASLIFSRYSRKILAPPKLVACRRGNSDLILLTGVVDFTLKVLLSLTGVFFRQTPFYQRTGGLSQASVGTFFGFWMRT